MGSLNIPEWTPDQVAAWMSGLGPKVTQYIPELHKKGLNGAKLLTLRCDDLEYLGVHVIGHQELILEAVEHLRNFHYEISRECVQQLALRVSSAAWSLARALRYHADARLETRRLADVARTVHAVKPLVCWLDRWPAGSSSPMVERKAELLKLSLEAATCAQRDRFAEQPARAVAAAAAALAALADYIIQEVADPLILQPATVDSVSLKQGDRALGFEVVPSFCGHHQLARIRFASPAHASGRVHEADEVVAVGGVCVLGWSGAAVRAACAAAGADLALRLRRRAAPPAPPAPRARLRHRPPSPPPSPPPSAPPSPCSDQSEDESEPLSPPASPTHPHHDAAREYRARPPRVTTRRHSVCGGSPPARRPLLAIHHFWQELQQRRWRDDDEPDDALYRRDKAVSCSTGLQLSPRPRTCLGVTRGPAPAAPPAPDHVVPAPDNPTPPTRGKLDKSHSTPAYDFDMPPPPRTPTAAAPPGPGLALASQPIPESPTAESPLLEKAGQILDFKKSSSQIEEAIQRNRRANDEDRDKDKDTDILADDDIQLIDDDNLEIVETVNTVLSVDTHISDISLRRQDSLKVKEPVNAEEMFTPIKYPKPRITERFRPCESPPSPPPRPSLARLAPPAPPPREHLQLARDTREPPTAGGGAALSAAHPALRLLPRVTDARDVTPFKPIRPGDVTQISVPLRHITKHDIKLISTERRELPPINGEPEPPPAPALVPLLAPAPSTPGPALTVGGALAGVEGLDSPKSGLSHSGSVVRGFFPSSKSRSLKKKNSILAKRREVPARGLYARAAGGRVWQRVRGRGAARWAPRLLLLHHHVLYAYRTPDCPRAACMLVVSGFTAAAAAEVHSRAHAFKVYHTGVCLYFAAPSRQDMLAWLQLLTRAATDAPAPPDQMELSKQFSETDYSETESDTESFERRNEKEREREREREKEKEKSKFGSLKKLTHRSGRSESQENVNQQAASTSLDRKYLRIFSRTKPKEDKTGKGKQSGVPVPTEHYRSYRRAPPGTPSTPSTPGTPNTPTHPPTTPARLPKPINYIHASNPNLLDFEKSDFVTKPAIQVPKPKVHKPDNFIGFVTLEEFMLKKQEEERQQVYTNRVLMGVEREGRGEGGGRCAAGGRGRELQQRLDRIVPDVIYGVSSADLPLPVLELQARHLPPAPNTPNTPNTSSAPNTPQAHSKPVSITGKDGYEKLVYPEERARDRAPAAPSAAPRASPSASPSAAPSAAPPSAAPSAAHDSSSATSPSSWSSGNSNSGGSSVSLLRQMFGGARRDLQRQESQREQYPHLQCPPTFQPETYSLRPARTNAHPPR